MEFIYRAISSKGKVFSGFIQAVSQEDAKMKLIEYGLTIKKVLTKNKSAKRYPLKKDLLLFFSSQLAQLLQAGLTLYEALQVLKDSESNVALLRILIVLIDALYQGESFSKALKHFPESFDDIYVSLIEAGEQSGNLVEPLDFLSKRYELELKFRKKITSQLIYPAIIAIFSIGIVVLLSTCVLPTLMNLFDEKKLPLITKALFNFGVFLKKFFIVILGAVFAIIWIFQAWLKSRYRIYWEQFITAVPLIKDIIMESQLCYLFAILSSLLRGGVNLLDGVRLAKHASRWICFKSLLVSAEQGLLQGDLLSTIFASKPLVPHLAIKLIRAGEKSGSLDNSFEQISQYYHHQTIKKLEHVTAILSPLLIVGMGLIIGIIVLSVLLPLTDFEALNF